MFINPMQSIDTIGGALQIGGVSTGGGTAAKGVFDDIFSDTLASVAETERAVAADVEALATGQIDDVHTLGINQAKAQISISMLVQLRNSCLDAYNELMRISL